jgi:hypothetical protein
VVKESADEVTVAMSFKDDFDFAARPEKFRASTGIEATYYITLKAGRAALDARIVLRNPHDQTIPYEYWTCTTLAPGSDPQHPRATAGAEIIAPISAYTTPAWSRNLTERDARAGEGAWRFEKLRSFRNWPTMGIAYAAPDMQGGNFWGVVNHDNEEGIVRIADNTRTRGLKMWTWGFPTFTQQADARTAPTEAQPYVELWGGVSDQFFHNADFPARSEIAIPETYSPTVGMGNVTHANESILVNLSAKSSGVTLQFVSVAPDIPLRVKLTRGDATLFEDVVKADPKNGNRVTATLPAGGSGDEVQLTITAADGRELIAAGARIE